MSAPLIQKVSPFCSTIDEICNNNRELEKNNGLKLLDDLKIKKFGGKNTPVPNCSQ